MAFQRPTKEKDIESAFALRNLSVTIWIAGSDSIQQFG